MANNAFRAARANMKELWHGISLRPLEARPANPRKGRPLVVGFLTSPIGLGVAARLIADAFAAAGVEAARFDVGSRLQPERATLPPEPAPDDDGDGPLIIHVNPPELGATLSLLGQDRLKGRRLVGVWAWEQERLPDGWAKTARWLDEIWTPSEFVARAVRNAVDVPVAMTGYPAGLFGETGDRPGAAGWRARLRLAPETFTVFASFDPRSNLMRKNPAGAVAAFREAFPDEENVRMVVKVTGTAGPEERAALGAEGDARVILVDGHLEAGDMLDLIAAADCIINLHRAEGYGLVPVQAMCMGRPAVMTGWSAALDFTECPGAFLTGHGIAVPSDPFGRYTPRLGDWAEPDCTDAADFLRKLRAMPAAERAALGAASAAWWRDTHSPAAWFGRLPATTRALFNTP